MATGTTMKGYPNGQEVADPGSAHEAPAPITGDGR